MLVEGRYSLDDNFFVERLQRLIKDHSLNTVVETGTNEGKSTVEFCRMAQNVISIDIDPMCIDAASKRLSNAILTNFELIQGHSPDVLRSLMTSLDVDKTLFFLDAHWEGPWPLLEEIKAITSGKGIIVIHDFKVPHKSFLASKML